MTALPPAAHLGLMLIGLGLCLAFGGPVFAASPSPSVETTPCGDIDAVLRAHDAELMEIPGVAGVYVGLLADGKTPCLRVMAVRNTPELAQRIPKSIEGCPVEIEETGPVEPLPGRPPTGGP